MRQKDLIGQIRLAVKDGIVNKEFSAIDFEFLSKSRGFLSKHAVGNGKYSEYFIRVRRGQYKLK